MKRAAVGATRDLSIRAGRMLERSIAHQGDNGLQRGPVPFQPLQVEHCELRRAQLPSPNQLGELGDRHERQGLGVPGPPQPDVPREPERTRLRRDIAARKSGIELDGGRHVIRNGKFVQRLIRLEISVQVRDHQVALLLGEIEASHRARIRKDLRGDLPSLL